jgi:signal transduction histidine kinase
MSLWNKKTKQNIQADQNIVENDEKETIVENLYKKNIEVVNQNKTLSLLSKLYEIGILTLEPKDLAARITQTVQADMSFELVEILLFDEKNDDLIPLALSKSEKLGSSLKHLDISIDDKTITNLKTKPFFQKAVYTRVESLTENIEEVWGGIINGEILQLLNAESHIKTSLLYPLMVENKVLGTILLSLNRTYESLNIFEKESIRSFINVISLALEKANLYKELDNANTQLKELDRQKDELLSIVSHQFATPVSALRWNFEMMLDGDTGKITKEQEDALKSMQTVTGDLSDLVSMILDVSRIQLGRMKLDKQELDLAGFYKEILGVIQPKAIERKIKFDVSIPAEFPKAMLDKRYTRMTIENLLSNAIKYTPEGGNVIFNVTLENGIMHCMVKDTGVGIPKADQDKIFGKLFRASNVRNTVDGNGFGLYVAKGAIESQGGKIWFESEEGKGTTFFIELPLIPNENEKVEE